MHILLYVRYDPNLKIESDLFHLIRMIQCFQAQIYPNNKKHLIFDCLPLELYEALYILYGHVSTVNNNTIEVLSYWDEKMKEKKIIKTFEKIFSSYEAEDEILVLFANIRRSIILPNHFQSFAKLFETTPEALWGYQRKIIAPKYRPIYLSSPKQLEKDFESLEQYGVDEPVAIYSIQPKQCFQYCSDQLVFRMQFKDLGSVLLLSAQALSKQKCKGLTVATHDELTIVYLEKI